jgi:hypothetical protein
MRFYRKVKKTVTLVVDSELAETCQILLGRVVWRFELRPLAQSKPSFEK